MAFNRKRHFGLVLRLLLLLVVLLVGLSFIFSVLLEKLDWDKTVSKTTDYFNDEKGFIETQHVSDAIDDSNARTRAFQKADPSLFKGPPLSDEFNAMFATDRRNCSYLPPSFPRGVPGIKRLRHICSHLHIYDHTLKKCMEQQSSANGKGLESPGAVACVRCVPPWGGPQWATDMTMAFRKREFQTRQKRIAGLRHILEGRMRLVAHSSDHYSNTVQLLVINHGYLYLMLNWLCSLQHIPDANSRTNGLRFGDDGFQSIYKSVARNTLVICTDKETFEYVKKQTLLNCVLADWMSDSNYKVPKEAARGFALGAHRWTISMQIAYVRDVLNLGFNVLLLDSDTIWRNYDLRHYMYHKLRDTETDIEMTFDGRGDEIGPGNSGFILLRSNCKMRIFMDTLLEYVGLVIAGRSDQRHWNMFLREFDFRTINFHLFPPDLFLSGHQWGNGRMQTQVSRLNPQTAATDSKKRTLRRTLLLSENANSHSQSGTLLKKVDTESDGANGSGKKQSTGDSTQQYRGGIIFAHAAWTGTHIDKVTKFMLIDSWFFTAERCPLHFEQSLLPKSLNLSEARMKVKEAGGVFNGEKKPWWHWPEDDMRESPKKKWWQDRDQLKVQKEKQWPKQMTRTR